MKTTLEKIAYGRSGDKGNNSNVGLIFINKMAYNWAKKNLTASLVKKYFSSSKPLGKEIQLYNMVLK